ncbi:MAG: hypothetical protein HYR49_10335 [Gammaproteobacteria bacterium]|nr:hypothetical protein [Gammaproteobacteria bacterium]
MNFRNLTAVLAALGMLAPSAASALALSNLEVLSKLNQPLHARVRLVSISQAELDSLSVRIEGIYEVSQPLAGLQQEVQQDETGHFLVVRSREPIREPVLTLVLDLSWSTGRLNREYHLIIDRA